MSNPVADALEMWKRGQEMASKENSDAVDDLPGLYIIPDSLRDAIYEKMAAAFLKRAEPCWPESAAWNNLYRKLLAYFNEHGVIPDFTITKGQ